MDNNITIQEYKNSMMRMIKLLYPMITDSELSNAIDYSIQKRLYNPQISVTNNYKNITIDMTLLQIANEIKTKRPIMSAYGVLFKRHQKDYNTPFYNLLETFITNRTKFKNKMFEYPKGTEEFQKYNLLQLLAKIDCNALYGVLGQYSSLVYNIYLAGSVTFQGRACISAAILFFESFLADNVQWGCLNEIIEFIDQVVYQDQRMFKDSDILDKNITLEEVYLKIMKNCGFNGWYPNAQDLNIIWDMLQRLTQEDLNRLYYRNNIYEFCENSVIKNAIIYILSLLEEPFMNPNKPPKTISVELDELLKMIKDYVYHPHLYMSRIDRVTMMNRSVSIITDTDSTIVSFDAWYRFVLSILGDKIIKLHNWVGEKKEYPTETGPTTDIDFATGKIINIPSQKILYNIDKKDHIRHSIINIMAYLISQLIGDYMKLLSANYNSYDGSRECLIVMKNEFLFKRVLLHATGKKNYASIQELQEGNIVPEAASMDVKGLPMNKSTLQPKIRQKLKDIMYNKILNAKRIDQIEVIKELAKAELEIKESLNNGDKDYYKPLKVKSMSSYENPMQMQGIRASVIYNKLRTPDMEAIDLSERNSIDVIKLNLTISNVSKIKDTYPEMYDKMVSLMNEPDFKDAIEYMALPANVDVPKWILPFVDVAPIIQDNLVFPVSSIGISDQSRASIPYTNIIQF